MIHNSRTHGVSFCDERGIYMRSIRRSEYQLAEYQDIRVPDPKPSMPP